MDPCGLNAIIAALTNYFYTSLTKDEFVCLSIFLNELSKSMFATTLFRDLCGKEGKSVFSGQARRSGSGKKDCESDDKEEEKADEK